jgi:hypothetical protein
MIANDSRKVTKSRGLISWMAILIQRKEDPHSVPKMMKTSQSFALTANVCLDVGFFHRNVEQIVPASLS